MADRAKKITELPVATGAANTDLLLMVANVSGTAITKSISFANAVSSMFSSNSNTVLAVRTINISNTYIFSGNASTRAAVNTQVGTTGSNGSIYLSTAGKIYLRVDVTGTATTDWQRVTTTAVD